MVRRPDGMNAFEFSVLSALRAVQLARGCAPRVTKAPNVAATALREVAEGKVLRSEQATESDSRPRE
jgi:DNA-directed RNA polymerase subunit K/omega